MMMPNLQPSTRRASTVGLATFISILSLASSAVAVPIKVPDWLRSVVTPSPSAPAPGNAVIIRPPTPSPSPAASTPSPSPASSPVAASSSTTEAGFRCQFVNGQNTVMYLPRSQPSLSFAWAVPRGMGGGWTAEKRCVEISRRLELYRPDGLIELQNAQENGYNTVCVTTQRTPGCRIVFTVPNGQDPVTTRDQVFQNIAYAESGQQTQGVNTFTSSGVSLKDILGGVKKQPTLTPRTASGGIDLRPFLDATDGGNGSRLTKGVLRKP